MKSRTYRVLGLVALLGCLTHWGPSPARARESTGKAAPARALESDGKAAERERFLEFLLRREDLTIAQVLERRKVVLEGRLEQLELRDRVAPLGPAQEQRVARAEQQVQRRIQTVDRKIADPPASPLRRRLGRREVVLQRQLQRIGSRLERLARMVPRNPRQERQIERVMEIWQRRARRTTERLEFIDRLVATPVTPRDLAGGVRR